MRDDICGPESESLLRPQDDTRIIERERERERGITRHDFSSITSFENLFQSWREFLCDKKKRKDVEQFSINLFENIASLRKDLIEKKYTHQKYVAFRINDPKPRSIHKATVRDRLLHHAIYRILYPYFERRFIYDSYSCRVNKGTHRAVQRFEFFSRKVSRNGTRNCWILKCDIRKFFATIDHAVLKKVLSKHITDPDILCLLDRVINSFSTEGKINVGLPLGNLTSQLLVNVYMNEFDYFMKRKLKVKFYIRYADDFAILSEDKEFLEKLLPKISDFLETELKLQLHPDKVFIKTLASGVDFLGWVHFPKYKVLRTTTKRRMFKRLSVESKKETIASYLGLLSHGNAHKIASEIRKSSVDNSFQ